MKETHTMKTTIALLLALAVTAVAEPRTQRNYILRRQQVGAVRGVPTSRLIIGRREIDIYRGPNGSKIMFERDNVVGVKP